METPKLFRAGLVGTIVAAVCCSTPILAVVFGVLGLTAWLTAADYVLIPALIASAGVTGYAAYRMWRDGRDRRQ
ncbi:MAG: mercury resistance system transport protein MerF [Candidatus Rokuibacteriota bacterium]